MSWLKPIDFDKWCLNPYCNTQCGKVHSYIKCNFENKYKKCLNPYCTYKHNDCYNRSQLIKDYESSFEQHILPSLSIMLNTSMFYGQQIIQQQYEEIRRKEEEIRQLEEESKRKEEVRHIEKKTRYIKDICLNGKNCKFHKRNMCMFRHDNDYCDDESKDYIKFSSKTQRYYDVNLDNSKLKRPTQLVSKTMRNKKLEQEKLEQEKLEQEKLEKEKLEQEKLEKEKLEQEQEKLEQEKEKLEQEKEKLEQDIFKKKLKQTIKAKQFVHNEFTMQIRKRKEFRQTKKAKQIMQNEFTMQIRKRKKQV